MTVAPPDESSVAPTLITSIINILFAPWLNSGAMTLVGDESPLPRWDGAPGVDQAIPLP